MEKGCSEKGCLPQGWRLKAGKEKEQVPALESQRQPRINHERLREGEFWEGGADRAGMSSRTAAITLAVPASVALLRNKVGPPHYSVTTEGRIPRRKEEEQ